MILYLVMDNNCDFDMILIYALHSQKQDNYFVKLLSPPVEKSASDKSQSYFYIAIKINADALQFTTL